jgi:uncharacterized repeat protein (TIGR03803 family)
MNCANDLLIGNPLRGNGWKKFFALTLVWVATALLAPAQTVTTLHSFNLKDGALPEFVTPAQGRDGDIYGTAFFGGSSTACGAGCGTVFKITPQGALTSVSFGVDGTEGAGPDAGLVLGPDGLLYGTTSSGGASGNGEVFSLNPKTRAITVLHSFNGSDGASPDAPLTLGPGGKYYGTTSLGGATNNGTVFTITRSGRFTSLRSFSGADGATPFAGLTVGSDGALYGVTFFGGKVGRGTIFRITASGTLTKLYEFDGTNGANPYGTLLLAADGNMYGTTSGDGITFGTVFKLTPAGVVTILHGFDGSDLPSAGLVQATDGKLYGTTFFGGEVGYGMIFSITTSGTFATLYSFPSPDGVDGENPFGLMQHTNGKLYGVTNQGGTSNNCIFFDVPGCGTVFSLDVGLGPFVKFVVPNGKVGSVIQILGTGLTGSTAVSFNGVPASSFKVISDAFMTATVPAGATTGRVKVTAPTRTLTSNVKFKVLP